MTHRSKTVAESRVERVQVLLMGDMNGGHRLFGGRLMEWIDLTAAAVARRHSNHDVTTVLVEKLEFSAPAYANDMVVLEGRMVFAGSTSMEVRVDSYVEDFDGRRKLINSAHIALVAIGDDGHPCEVPALEPATPGEQADYNEAKARYDMRKQMPRH